MLPAPLADLHRSLGIAPDYATGRGLVPQAEADEGDLVSVATTDDGRAIRLVAPAAAAWREMHAAAVADGIALLPLSGFRSVARQAAIVQTHLAAGRSLVDILRTIAAPGFSEHHTGCALDLGTPGEPPLEESFASTPAFAWLRSHAAKFGFTLSYPRDNPHGIVFEPWHWRWTPRRPSTARAMLGQ